jgi:hypothetical protein
VPDVVWIADIAKRLRLDFTTVRRLIAKEKDALQITLRRGKGDKFFLYTRPTVAAAGGS